MLLCKWCSKASLKLFCIFLLAEKKLERIKEYNAGASLSITWNVVYNIQEIYRAECFDVIYNIKLRASSNSIIPAIFLA
jgi:hypothetical protein